MRSCHGPVNVHFMSARCHPTQPSCSVHPSLGLNYMPTPAAHAGTVECPAAAAAGNLLTKLIINN